MCNNLLLNFIPVLAYYVYMHICSVEVDELLVLTIHKFYWKFSCNTLLLSRGGKASLLPNTLLLSQGGKASLLPPTTRVERFAGDLA